MSKPATLIWNPRAGRGGAHREREVVEFCRYLEANGTSVDALRTNAPGAATMLARQAVERGTTNIIVSGGDGTINEALQSIVGAEGVRLGIWARGTANVLARELKLPFNAKRAAEVVARGTTRRLHVGCATEETSGARRYFFLMAGVGLDASVVHRVNNRLKRRVGQAAFWYSGLSHLASWQPVAFQVEIDGAAYPATFAAVGKAPRYGGNLLVTPRAQIDAPFFEVCVVDSTSRFRYLRLLAHTLRSGVPEEGAANIRFFRTTRVRATGDAPVQIDGELVGALPMTFEIVPHPIAIIAS